VGDLARAEQIENRREGDECVRRRTIALWRTDISLRALDSVVTSGQILVPREGKKHPTNAATSDLRARKVRLAWLSRSPCRGGRVLPVREMQRWGISRCLWCLWRPRLVKACYVGRRRCGDDLYDDWRTVSASRVQSCVAIDIPGWNLVDDVCAEQSGRTRGDSPGVLTGRGQQGSMAATTASLRARLSAAPWSRPLYIPLRFVKPRDAAASRSLVRLHHSASIASPSRPGTRPLSCPCRLPIATSKWSTRPFHSTLSRRDVLFVTVPAFKALLLSVTRVALVILPFWWR
jgi:hypothetical protein